MRKIYLHIIHGSFFTAVLCSVISNYAFGSEPAIIITETNGSTFTTGPFIKQFVLGDAGGGRNNPQNYGHPTSYSVADPEDADRHIFARKMWDESAYGGQGALIARKLLTFGTDDDVRLVREALLTASINADGFVDTATSKRWHLGQQAATIESNAEYVLMAHAYLLHTGDAALFRASISRIVCAQDEQNIWRSVVHKDLTTFDCNRPISQDRNSPTDYHNINSTVYLESIRGSNWYQGDRGYFDNPGRILGQLVEIHLPFKSIRLPVAKRCCDPIWKFQVYIVNNDTCQNGTCQTVLNRIFEDSIFSGHDATWLDINLPTIQPAGHYNIEIHPVRDDTINQTESYWRSIRWLNDVGSHLTGGATTKLYHDNPFIGSQSWTLTSKLEQAFNWSLRRSLGNPGKFGIFINPFKHFRGTGEPQVSTASYYDLFNAGYKDSYSMLRYMEALTAYFDLQEANVVRTQINETDIGNVKTDFYRQMVDPMTGHVISWIGCSSYADEQTPLCNPTSVDDFSVQHPYDVEFLPSQALAARLLNDYAQYYPMITSRLAYLRAKAWVTPGEFRTNIRPVEEVTAGIWNADDRWGEKIGDYPNGRFWARYEVGNILDFSQKGDWHIFNNGVGNGNFGNEENNGGVLLSTTAFIFEAGPYPDIYSDWKTFVTKLNLIGAWIKNGSGNTGGFYEYLRKPIQDPFVKLLCQRVRYPKIVGPKDTAPSTITPKDHFGWQWCDFYKSVSYNLPESGAVAHSFVLGLLNMRLLAHWPGRAYIYNETFVFNKRDSAGQFVSQSIPMTQKQIALWPPQVKTVTVSGFRFNGRVLALTCDRIPTGLMCTENSE